MGHQTRVPRTKEVLAEEETDRANVINSNLMRMMNFRELLKSPKKQQKLRRLKEGNLRRRIQMMILILEKILNSLRPTISLRELEEVT